MSEQFKLISLAGLLVLAAFAMVLFAPLTWPNAAAFGALLIAAIMCVAIHYGRTLRMTNTVKSGDLSVKTDLSSGSKSGGHGD